MTTEIGQSYVTPLDRALAFLGRCVGWFGDVVNRTAESIRQVPYGLIIGELEGHGSRGGAPPSLVTRPSGDCALLSQDLCRPQPWTGLSKGPLPLPLPDQFIYC